MIDEKQRTSDAFIDDARIARALDEGKRIAADPEAVRRIIAKAALHKGLTAEETAVLLQVEDPALLNEMFSTASEIKKAIYGKRIVLFAPLYLSSHCVNNCAYCGYKFANKDQLRHRLTMEELRKEVEIMESLGHKRLAVEAGEHPTLCPLDYVLEAIKEIYKVKRGKGDIRRVNINIAATTIEEYQQLKATNSSGCSRQSTRRNRSPSKQDCRNWRRKSKPSGKTQPTFNAFSTPPKGTRTSRN